MEWLAGQGAQIYVPVGHSPDVDLVALLDGRLLRVEVKTGTCRTRRWSVRSRPGRQSELERIVKYFDRDRCDYLFVHVGDGRRWFIPTAALRCRSQLTLGGSRYAEFEIEPGRPLLGTA